MAFTSDLSVAEFALAAEAGLRPLRLVGGAGVFRLPPPTRQTEPRYLRPGQAALLTDRARRWNDARGTVLARLQIEAAACGAELVTGVSLRHRVPARTVGGEPAHWYREFTATGTAMAYRDSPGRQPGDRPVLTGLRLAGYQKLTAAGLVPAGLATSTAVAAVRSSWEYDDPMAQSPGDRPDPDLVSQRAAAWRAQGRAGDRPEYHAALRQAYSAAVRALGADAGRMGATGVEAVTVERDRARWSLSGYATHTAVFVHMTGTAVTARGAGPGPGLRIMPVRHLNA